MLKLMCINAAICRISTNSMALNNLFRLCYINNWALKMYQRLACSTSIKIGLTDDESTFVAWHPKQDFPYECTKPLPEPQLENETSVLKTKLTPELQEIFNKKTPEMARQELMNITHTTKHRWFPRSRDRKAKRTPMQREYL